MGGTEASVIEAAAAGADTLLLAITGRKDETGGMCQQCGSVYDVALVSVEVGPLFSKGLRCPFCLAEYMGSVVQAWNATVIKGMLK